MKLLLIVGAGEYDCSVAEVVFASDEFVGADFFDDAFQELKRVWGVPVLGNVVDLAQWRGLTDCAFVAIGNNVFRQRVTAGLWAAGFSLVNVRHLWTIVSPGAVIGDGSTTMAGAPVGTEARLSDRVIVNCAAVVDNHRLDGDFGRLRVNAAMAGGSVLALLVGCRPGQRWGTV